MLFWAQVINFVTFNFRNGVVHLALSNIVLVGAGGLGREVLFQLWEINKVDEKYNILGFVDDDENLIGTNINGIPVIGRISDLIDFSEDLCVAVCIANPAVRRYVVNLLSKNTNIRFPSIIAPDLRCSDYVRFGKGCIISFSNIITIDIKIMDFVLISNACTIGHDSVIHEFATIYNAVNISGNVKIGSCTEIGTGTKIIQGISVGDNTVLGAGSVVVHNIPHACTAVGIPARPIKYHN